MPSLNDLFKVDETLENFKNIRSPEDLLSTIQGAKDIFSSYASQLKKIPNDLMRWENTLKSLGLLSENTDMVSGDKDILFKEVYNLTQGTILEGKLGLEKIISNKNYFDKSLIYSIDGIKLDYVYNLKPTYITSSASTPIVSSKDIDRLNEHAENENPTYSMQVGLKGDDADRRFEQILSLKNSKKLVKVITNKVFEKVLIKKISLTYNNKEGILFDISFEDVFVAQLKRTANRLVVKGADVTETASPTTPEQVPTDDVVKETLSETKSLGIVTPITYGRYNAESAQTIGYGGRSY